MEGLKALDYSVFRAINFDLNSPFLTAFFWVVTSTGLGWVQCMLSLFLWRSAKWRPVFWVALVNLPLCGLVVRLFKDSIQRDRPSQLVDSVVAVDEKLALGSFPSGHTTGAFALAAGIWLLAFKNGKPWVGVGAMVWAALVGVSRVYRGLHWPSDAMAGALLGIVLGTVSFLIVEAVASRRSGVRESGGSDSEPPV